MATTGLWYYRSGRIVGALFIVVIQGSVIHCPSLVSTKNSSSSIRSVQRRRGIHSNPNAKGYPKTKQKKRKTKKRKPSKYLLVTHEQQHPLRNHQSLPPTSFGPSQLLPRYLRRLVVECGRLAISEGLRKIGRSVFQSILMRVTGTLKVVTTVAVRTRVDIVVPEGLQQLEKPASQESTEHGTQPVDPVVSREVAVDNGRAEGADRVETAAGKIDAC